MIAFLRYRSEEWLMEAHERHVAARRDLGEGITPADHRAPFWVLAASAIASIEHELGRRNLPPPSAPF